jgi:G6PDH family F420-dependent oxidoreductase
MLEESIALMRELWNGQLTTHHGRYYEVENARLYSCPEQPPPIYVSAFGPSALRVAAQIGDGLVTTRADADMVRKYRELGGRGPAIAATKLCWAEDEAVARKTAHRLWATECLPGQLNQELALPSHFGAAAELVTEDMVAEAIPCGPDPDKHAESIAKYVDAGFDEIYINQVGDDQAGFLHFYETELAPRINR